MADISPTSAETNTEEQLRTQVSVAAEVLKEQNWADAGEKLSAIRVNDKVIEQKERELIDCIAHNYSKIKGVERELAGLQLQLRLTSGPKKSALELLRKKIELQNDKVVLARGKFHALRKELQAAEEWLKAEEAVKERLCQELNLLVQQSAHAQLERLEQLTQRMEMLNRGFMPPAEADSAVLAATPTTSSTQAPQKEYGAADLSNNVPNHDSSMNAQKEVADAAPSSKASPLETTGLANEADIAGVAKPERPSISGKVNQERAAAARGRHVKLQKSGAAPPEATVSTIRPTHFQHKPAHFSGFD